MQPRRGTIAQHLLDAMIAALFGMTALLWWSPSLALARLRRQGAGRGKRSSAPLDGNNSAPTEDRTSYLRVSEALRRLFIRRMRRELIAAVPRGAVVLDVGAGNGELAATLRDERGAQVTCLDVA